MPDKISTFIPPKKAEADWCIPILAWILDNVVEGPKSSGVYIPRAELDAMEKRLVAMEVKENGDIRVFLLPEAR